MALSPTLESALRNCADAAVAPDRWAASLDQLAWAMNSKASMLLAHGDDEIPHCIARSNGSFAMDRYWDRNRDWVYDIYRERAVPLARCGRRALLDTDIFSVEEMRTSRFHLEVAKPAGLAYWSTACFAVEGQTRCLPFFRGSQPFSVADLEILAELAERMAPITTLAEKVAAAAGAIGIRLLERLDCAALLVDARGYVVGMNAWAEAAFSEVFRVRGGRLWTANEQANQAMNAVIHWAVSGGWSGKPPPGPAVVPEDGVPRFVVTAMTSTGLTRDRFGAGRAIVLISNLAEPARLEPKLLTIAFGLTAAEARLAVALAGGSDLDVAASCFGISRQTVRSQLRAVFAKTGCRRQAELVSMVGRFRTPTLQ